MFELHLRKASGLFHIWIVNDVREVFALMVEHNNDLFVIPLD